MAELRDYKPKEIEARWQARWAEKDLYKTPTDATHVDKYFLLPQLPYPSGTGLHVGHAEIYTACDIVARFMRMKGKKVLHAIGWDSFGLPAENYAIKTNIHPKITTSDSIQTFKEQIDRLGISVDWEREINTSEPEYYKWTQWLFLLMFQRGLAYRKEQNVNWCPTCLTVLSNEQINQGKCERCESFVEQRLMNQWFFKITEYADRLIDDLDKVDWPEESIKRQRDWIGRSEGLEIKYQISNSKFQISVFTTRPDTSFGATFVTTAIDSEFVKEHLEEFPNLDQVKDYIKTASAKTELERLASKEKTGVDTGLTAINILTGKEMPIYVADYVLGSVGTGSVMGVPGHDARDFEFAKAHNLEIVRVVVGSDGDTTEITKPEQVQENEGIMTGSGDFDGLEIMEAKEKIGDHLVELGVAKKVVNYRLRDWSVSRQRFWGAPIPIVYDPEGNPQAVDDSDLPVLLPEDVNFVPTGVSPLKFSLEFQEGVAELYGKGYKREVDTLDTFVCSSFYFLRYLDPHNKMSLADAEKLTTWMPVDFYMGGPEHVNGHLLYARFVTKVLFDAGYLKYDEPFMKHRHQGTIWGEDGRIMSKRFNNIVNPLEVADMYGADTLRMYEMFLGPLEQAKPFSFTGIKGIHRFLVRVYNFWETHSQEAGTGQNSLDEITKRLVKDITNHTEKLQFNVAIARMMEALHAYEKKGASIESFETFLKLLAPYAPHLTEELWEELGHKDSIHLQHWPEVEKEVSEFATIVVMVNGKFKHSFQVSTKETEDEDFIKQRARDLIPGDSNLTFVQIIYVPGKLVNFVTKG